MKLKRADKQRRKLQKAFEMLERQWAAKATYLWLQEMQFDRRLRNKALRLAKRRKVAFYV